MAMKKGTIKSLDNVSKIGFIAGEKDSIVIFDEHDLREVQFSELKEKTAVLYRDLKVSQETFRDALRVVLDASDVNLQGAPSRKIGVVCSWNSKEGIGVLQAENGNSVIFSATALDETFGQKRPDAGTIVEYDDQCVHGRRIATLLKLPTNSQSTTLAVAAAAVLPAAAAQSWPQGTVSSVNPISGRGLIIADNPSGAKISFTKGTTAGSAIKFEHLEKCRVEYQLLNSITAREVKSV